MLGFQAYTVTPSSQLKGFLKGFCIPPSCLWDLGSILILLNDSCHRCGKQLAWWPIFFFPFCTPHMKFVLLVTWLWRKNTYATLRNLYTEGAQALGTKPFPGVWWKCMNSIRIKGPPWKLLRNSISLKLNALQVIWKRNSLWVKSTHMPLNLVASWVSVSELLTIV